jgi:transposase
MKQEMYVLGIAIAKRVFHAVGMDDRGNGVYRKRLSQHDLMPCIAKLPPVGIGIEVCGGAHDWARRFRTHGHEVKLMAPQCVKPYGKSNKNDSRDAEAIAEAATRPTMRFVPAKDVDQQDIQALHRVRERLIGEQTALVHAVHGLLHEYGIVIPKGVAKFRQAVVGKLVVFVILEKPKQRRPCFPFPAFGVGGGGLRSHCGQGMPRRRARRGSRVPRPGGAHRGTAPCRAARPAAFFCPPSAV